MEDHATLEKDLLDIGKASSLKGCLLLGSGHVELIIGHSTFTHKVIGDEIAPSGNETSSDLRMQERGVALVAKHMNRLVGDHEVELAQSFSPRWIAKAALDEVDAISQGSEPLGGELMHGSREVKRHKIDRRERLQQMFGKETRARAQFQHATRLALARIADGGGERGKELGAPRAPDHGQVRPLAGVVRSTEINGAWDICVHADGTKSVIRERACEGSCCDDIARPLAEELRSAKASKAASRSYCGDIQTTWPMANLLCGKSEGLNKSVNHAR